MSIPTDLYIDGRWVPGSTGRRFGIENPAMCPSFSLTRSARGSDGRLTVLAPVVYTETRFLPALPVVPVAAIVTDEDFMVADAEGLKANMRSRLGVEPTVLPGGHSPFLSHPAD